MSGIDESEQCVAILDIVDESDMTVELIVDQERTEADEACLQSWFGETYSSNVTRIYARTSTVLMKLASSSYCAMLCQGSKLAKDLGDTGHCFLEADDDEDAVAMIIVLFLIAHKRMRVPEHQDITFEQLFEICMLTDKYVLHNVTIDFVKLSWAYRCQIVREPPERRLVITTVVQSLSDSSREAKRILMDEASVPDFTGLPVSAAHIGMHSFATSSTPPSDSSTNMQTEEISNEHDRLRSLLASELNRFSTRPELYGSPTRERTSCHPEGLCRMLEGLKRTSRFSTDPSIAVGADIPLKDALLSLARIAQVRTCAHCNTEEQGARQLFLRVRQLIVRIKKDIIAFHLQS